MAKLNDLKEVKYIDLMSYGKISAVIFAIIGFIYGLIISLIFIPLSSVVSTIGGGSAGGLWISLGAAAVIFLPIVFGIIGFVLGVVSALIYNFVAGKVGGVKIRLE